MWVRAAVVVVAMFGMWGLSNAEQAPKKRPLDLPVGGVSEEDDVAEDVIFFFGNELEGDTFFFFLVAMSEFGDSSDEIKRELMESVDDLSRSARFTVIAHTGGGLFEPDPPAVWSGIAKPATRRNKADVRRWVMELEAILNRDFLDGALLTVETANGSSKRNKVIVFCGNTVPVSLSGLLTEEYIETLTSANTRRIPIHTFYVTYLDWDPIDPIFNYARDFWRGIAINNGGTYTEILD